MKDIDYTRLDYTRWSFRQRLFQKAFALGVRLLGRLHIEGIEKIPSGAFVAATNHTHNLDMPVYFSISTRPTICFVSDSWKNKAGFNWFLSQVGQVIFVALREESGGRNVSNRKALSQALSVLRSGGILALAPQGGRSLEGLQPGLPGIAYLANRGSVPVQTVVVYGQELAIQHWKRFRRVPVYVRFGPLIRLPEHKMKSGELLEQTHRIMVELARLLPPEYRGVYHDVE